MIKLTTHRCTVTETNRRYLWVALFIKPRKRALISFTLSY